MFELGDSPGVWFIDTGRQKRNGGWRRAQPERGNVTTARVVWWQLLMDDLVGARGSSMAVVSEVGGKAGSSWQW